MKKYLTFLFSIFITISGCTQNSEYMKYINSFKEENTNDILKFGKIVQINNRMTKEEALAFVYNGDTAKLFCNQSRFNMVTEKVEGMSRELYLPDKCMRLDMGNYFLIAYSSYKCNDSNELLIQYLTIGIINKEYQKIDSLLVYKGSDYGPEITGLINVKSEKIFLFGNLKNQSSLQAILYKINPQSLKFEQIKEEEDINLDSSNLQNVLNFLGWSEFFRK